MTLPAAAPYRAKMDVPKPVPNTRDTSRLLGGLLGIWYGVMTTAVLSVGVGLVFAAFRAEHPFVVQRTYLTASTSMDTVRDRVLPFAIPIGAIVGLIIAERRRTPK